MKKISILTIIFIFCFTGLSQGQGLTFNVNESMLEALKSINVDTFRQLYGADGSGIKVAIIDTGVDVSHPDLQKTTQGKVKIKEYMDFTNEGYVNTKTSVRPKNDKVTVDDKSYNIAGIYTSSGLFHIGFFKESQLDQDSPIWQDVNRNGRNDDIFGVLVADSELPGAYDTVYVDTNQNFDFSDEEPLKVYLIDQKWACFGKDNPATDYYVEESSFVVSTIDINGSYVNLSFDGNGHGTHVAGIIGANGRFLGTAPGVELIAVKALSSSGEGNWEDIFKAIEYAAEQGADIINVSIGDLVASKEGHKAQLRILEELSLESDVLIVIAVGNNGPGLATAYDTASSENIITVGAYMSPELWKTNYNVNIPYETLWYYSGVGHGSSRPTVVAPSSVISTVGRWDTGGYFLMNGTSMAAPFVSGSCALLLEQAKKEGIPVSAQSLKKAIKAGARLIDGYLEIEQGSGLVNVVRSWDVLKQAGLELQKPSNLIVSLPDEKYTSGITFRGQLKAQQKLLITNKSDTPLAIKFISNREWLNLTEIKNEIVLNHDKPQSITLSYQFPEKPGLYTANTVGYNTVSGKPVMDFMTVAVVPYDLAKCSNILIKDNLLPTRWERYYFKVVPGMSELDIALTVLEQDKTMGRALIYVYDPDGQKVYEDAVGADYLSPKESISFKTPQPKSGIWEVVVASDYDLSNFDAAKTFYELNVQAAGVFTNFKELALWVPEGEKYISREIMLKNGAKPFNVRLEGMGLAEQNEGIELTKVSVRDGEFIKGPEISVPQNTMSLRIDIIDPDDCNGDVDLYLYRKNPETGLYEETAYSTKIDVLHESIYLMNPKPGEYVVYIDGFSIPDTVAELYVKTQVLRDKRNVYIQDISGELEPEQQWKSRLYINIPPIGSTFTGYIAVKDESGDEISQIPLKLVVGKKQLAVHRHSDDSIAVREKDTNNPVDTVILVNGIEYAVINGKAVIPTDTIIQTIEIYDERYGPVILETTMEDVAF